MHGPVAAAELPTQLLLLGQQLKLIMDKKNLPKKQSAFAVLAEPSYTLQYQACRRPTTPVPSSTPVNIVNIVI